MCVGVTMTVQPPTTDSKITVIIAVSVGSLVAVLAVVTATVVLILWLVKKKKKKRSKHGIYNFYVEECCVYAFFTI